MKTICVSSASNDAIKDMMEIIVHVYSRKHQSVATPNHNYFYNNKIRTNVRRQSWIQLKLYAYILLAVYVLKYDNSLNFMANRNILELTSTSKWWWITIFDFVLICMFCNGIKYVLLNVNKMSLTIQYLFCLLNVLAQYTFYKF